MAPIVADHRWWRMAGKLAFAAVLAHSMVVGATLMAGHFFTLPRPAQGDPRLQREMRALAAATRPAGGARWTMVHVLYGRCRCSSRIFDAIAAGPRPSDVDEVVLAVDPVETWAARTAARAIPIVPVDRESLERRFGIEAAPLLVVLDPAGSVAYAGGYTQRKQGPEIEDLSIVAALRSGRHPRELPLYGCATALELAAALDPLGVK